MLDATNNERVPVDLLINNRNLMVILRRQGMESLSMLLADIISRYGEPGLNLVEK